MLKVVGIEWCLVLSFFAITLGLISGCCVAYTANFISIEHSRCKLHTPNSLAYSATLLKTSSSSPPNSNNSRRISKITALNVLAEPPKGGRKQDGYEESRKKQNNKYRNNKKNVRKFKQARNHHGQQNNYSSSLDTNRNSNSFASWQQAEQVEAQLNAAVDSLQQALIANRKNSLSAHPLVFPSIRDCNAALAVFGDSGDLLRPLRLYAKMRRSASLAKKLIEEQAITWPVPSPTLVTYSTIMSRAVHHGKPRAALRLWRIMRLQADFFSSKVVRSNNIIINNGNSGSSTDSASTHSTQKQRLIIPDVKAANILMNCFAKLGDVSSAQNLLHQMLTGTGPDVPRLSPNLVTYNTLLNAHHMDGDLDEALKIKSQIEKAGFIPDARTYTTLIATVARKASSISGAYDPTIAFSLLVEMQQKHIQPNGVTYCALIDVCGRCNRSDLALKGLRIMLNQKRKEQELFPQNNNNNQKGCNKSYNKNKDNSSHTLVNEVGAWTATINACGKGGRIDTAIRLFYAMSKFGVQPNTITCACLTDSLLKHGRTSDTLGVLRYMKKNRIPPSKFMYASLMSSAGRLVQFEKNNNNNSSNNNNKRNKSENYNSDRANRRANSIGRSDDKVVINKNFSSNNRDKNYRIIENNDRNANQLFPVDESGDTKAIEVYTELIHSLLDQPTVDGTQRDAKEQIQKNTSDLLKVFLVFQEMKAVGAQLDLACYNALLKACANAADVNRAGNVLKLIRNSDHLQPNDNSWREMIRAAGKAGRVDVALSTWRTALADRQERQDEEKGEGDDDNATVLWQPSAKTVEALVTSISRVALHPATDNHTKLGLCELVTQMYESIHNNPETPSSLSSEDKMGMYLVDKSEFKRNPRLLVSILQIMVAYDNDLKLSNYEFGSSKRERVRNLACSIVSLDCFNDGLPESLERNRYFARAYRIGQSWAKFDGDFIYK